MAVKFLGCSVIDYTSSLGWGDQPSTCNINLVEDEGDSFQTPVIGSPYVFSFQSWQFGGLIQSWKYREGSGGKIYEIVMIDPRTLLDGVTLILGGYSGSTNGVANLLNVFGYWENISFGSSQRNSAGMPWQLVKSGIVALTQGLSPTFGDAIAIGPYNFELNLDDLPNLPSFYRITAENMTLMEFVKEVCDAASHDYFFSLNFDREGRRYITISTVNRNMEPVFGAITNFVASTDGAVQKDAGFELRQETTGKFVVGGPLSDIYFRESNGEQDDPWDSTIWPFWGFSSDGRLLIGEGVNDAHSFTLDASWMPEWGGNTYKTDVGEMRAAKENIDVWKKFLSLNNRNRYRIVQGGEETEEDDDGREYKTDGSLNPHYRKASVLKLEDADFLQKVVSGITDVDQLDLNKFNNLKKTAINQARLNQENLIQEQIVNQIYSYISSFAHEYYGRKFMVKLEDVNAAIETETDTKIYSVEPESSGFIDESRWATAIANNLLPLDINKFTESNGRVFGFVRFDNYTQLDLREISEDAVCLGANGRSVFVKCEIEPTLFFRNPETLEDPRAVVTLPGTIKQKIASTAYYQAGWAGLLANALFIQLSNQDDPASTNQIISKINSLFNSPGGDRLNYGIEPYAIQPDVAAIPLRSNVATYGPWYVVGSNGKMEFEADSSLVPWNYGGFSAMNVAAEAKVASALLNYQQSENGSVEFPGVPSKNLGDALVDSGPYITDISVVISNDGIRTTYRMNTWTPQPYKTSKQAADVVSRLAKKSQQIRRNSREQAKNVGRAISVQRSKQLVRSLGRRRTSTHDLIFGENISDGTPGRGFGVVYGADYDAQQQMSGDFTKKAGQSLDALFRPFTTDINSSGLPILSPADSSNNPYQGSDFGFIVHGDEIPDGYSPIDNDVDESKVRAIGFMTPAVFVGYGKDISGNPVPSGEDGNYLPDYKKRQDKWKAGPLDIRWNDETGMWTFTKCDARNETHQLFVIGQATGGTFSWTLPIISSTGTMTFDYNETASSFSDKMVSQHPDIDEGDVLVGGGPLPYANLSITYQGALKNRAIPYGTMNWQNLEGFGTSVIITRYEKGYNE